MDHEHILENQTVIVRDDVIERIGDSEQEENPLEDVANVSKRVGVMLRGYWLHEG